MYHYKVCEGYYSVGFYSSTGKWVSVGDYTHEHDAMCRVHYLNGGFDTQFVFGVVEHLCNCLRGIETQLEHLKILAETLERKGSKIIIKAGQKP